MKSPVAVSLLSHQLASAHSIKIDAPAAQRLRRGAGQAPPPILVVDRASFLPEAATSVVDADSIIYMTPGEWVEGTLIVINGYSDFNEQDLELKKGDQSFLAHVALRAPHLHELAKTTIAAIRSSGVDGSLVEAGGDRWVNKPLNVFTLKAQPRANNIHFTLYGNPSDFSAGTFLKRDQNSYSRGWVKNEADSDKLSVLAKQSWAKRRNK